MDELKPIEYVTSGIEEIDAVTKFPRARVTEIYGKQGVGKTSLMTRCLTAMSKEGTVLYIDSENALNIDRVMEAGADPSKITVSTAYMLEDVANLVIASVGKYDIIIVDSIAGLVTRTEHDGETGNANIGIKAKLIHQWMRKTIGKLGKSKTALVLVNQLREGLDMWTPKYTTGGVAIPYASSLRIELTSNKADRIGKAGEYSGHWVHFEITKSKVCKPHQIGKFKLSY